MKYRPGWWRALRRLWQHDALERGLDEEIQFHLEQQAIKHAQSGLPPDEARRRAFVRFGGVEPMKELTRDQFRPAFIQDFWRDIKVGARTLVRAPAFATVAILTIGLGTGAATAVFSVVNGVLLRPLPYPRSERLVRLYQRDAAGARSNVSGLNFDDWQALTHSFAGMALMANWGPTPVIGGSEPTLAPTARVSRAFFDVMDVRPAMGRTFSPEELKAGGTPAAIVSWTFWQRTLGAAPDFARPLRIGGGVYGVVGVMPAGFEYPNGTAVWLARELDPPDASRTAHNFQAIGRLRDGVALEAAQAEISRVSRDLKTRYGDDTWMADALAVPLLEQLTAASRDTLQLLFGAALLLLVIANMNVSSLLLARAAARRSDFAIQLAIGAGRLRIARQLLAETAVLCVAGGAVGALTAAWGVRALVALGPRTTPRLAEAAVDWSALAFALGVTVVSTIALGLLMSLGARTAAISSVLSDRSRSGTLGRRSLLARQVLVVVQVALTLVLLAGSGLLAQSFVRLLAVEPGFTLDNALVLDLTLADGGSDYRVRRVAQIDELLSRLGALPGVTHTGMTSGFPLGGGNYSNGQFLEMTSADELRTEADLAKLGAAVKSRAGSAGFRIASDDYFRTMGIPLLRGRVFDPGDGPDAAHVAVISQSLAEARWPGRDPIGRFVQFGNMDGDRRGFRVVGVVGDVRELTLEVPPAPLLYASYRQRPNSVWRVSLVVRGPEPDAIAPAVRRIVHDVNRELPVQIRTVDRALNAVLTDRRFSLVLISVFGASALALAILGLYALVAYAVQQRTREIGIRMALGASSGRLFAQVAGQGAVLAMIGCAAGLAAGLALTRVVEGLLFGVAATDPFVLGAVAAVTVLASVAASALPARRATRVSPVSSLRAS